MAYIGFNLDTTSQLVFFIIILIWELAWKGFALYKAGKKQQPVWFVLLLILNTVGILPIIYLLISRDKKQKTISKKRK